jgi:hypothetical protein
MRKAIAICTALLLVSALLVACQSAGAKAEDEYVPLTDPNAEPPSPPEDEAAAAAEAPRTNRVTIREDAIEFNGRTLVRLVHGDVPKYPATGGNDMTIPPVARAFDDALASDPDNRALIIDAGPKVKYRVMIRVLHTAQRAGYEDFYIQGPDAATQP